MAISIVDGNGGTDQATVKPGSTAAVAADKPLVITAHPSSAPLPVTLSGTTPVSNTATPADSIPATQNITIVDSASTTTAQQSGQNAITGTPTAGSAASFVIANEGMARVEVTGTWTGTLSLEVSPDGVVWTTQGSHLTGTVLQVGSFTQNVIGILNVTGCAGVRLRATAAITGTATVKIALSNGGGVVYVANAIKLVDGSGGMSQMSVKAASTAAIATDLAGVVALHPSNPLPAGSNALGSVAVTQSTAAALSGAWPVQITDKTNTMPTMDAIARAGFVQLTDGTTKALIDSDGALNVSSQGSNSATLTNVAASASNVTLLSSNSGRDMASFFNDSTANAYLKFGATASLTSFTVKIFPGTLYELPTPAYTGQIDCIWDAANGTMRVTEQQ